jgi:transitional endoplasmic reticulum ATPase
LRGTIKSGPMRMLAHYGEISAACRKIQLPGDYPLTRSHLAAAKMEISQSPTKKGKVQLDEFLEAELSQEPQVGFIIGAGANDLSGVLLPIATSLTYRVSDSNVLVTGAVSSTSAPAAELDMAVQMTQQSAQEALTMVKNYLQQLSPKISTARLLGDFLENYTIHHQLLSASYNVGGPSAGYALAINTLSALMLLPVFNDFGITGAPWTKGVRSGEVGGSVIIGGHKKKTEKVLTYLNRMYMPLKNYMDLDQDFLMGYWSQGKDILGVTHFGDLVPEVLWLDAAYEERLHELLALRIGYKMAKSRGTIPPADARERILVIKNALRKEIEKQIRARLDAMREYLRSPIRDPHLSLNEIYQQRPRRGPDWGAPIMNLMRNLKTSRRERRKNRVAEF